MKNKPAKRFFESTNYSNKQCDEKGCNEEGNFIAPKSPNSNEKYFFCLKHIKLYNKSKVRIPAHKAWDQFKHNNLKITKLKNGLLHPSFTGIHMHLDKLNKYSTLVANIPSKKAPLEIILRIWFGIPFYFIHKFIFR